MDDLIPFIHKTCGNIAFYYTHRPLRVEKVELNCIRMIDKVTIPVSGSIMICGSCNNQMTYLTVYPEGGYK